MTMINKEKVLKGVGKAVDAANNAADKAAAFAKEKETYRTKCVDRNRLQPLNFKGWGRFNLF